MFVGHIGAGLVLKRMERRANLGVLFLAVMFSDLLLWVLVLLGVESVIIPDDFSVKHYLTFVFPYSHGLVANLGWALLAGFAVWGALGSGSRQRMRLAVVVGVAVLSHFFLDLLVHVPELPLLGEGSPKVGLGLWNTMAIALPVELAITAAGLYFYLHGSTLQRPKAMFAAGLVVLLAAMTVAGPYLAAAPPPPLPSLITILVIALMGFWIDGRFSISTPS